MDDDAKPVIPGVNAFTDEEIKEIESIWRRVAPFAFHEEEDSHSFVLKRGDERQWRAFESDFMDDEPAKKAGALKQFCRATVVAVAHDGQKLIARDAQDIPKVRALFDSLLKEFPSATASGELARCVMRMHGQATSRGK